MAQFVDQANKMLKQNGQSWEKNIKFKLTASDPTTSISIWLYITEKGKGTKVTFSPMLQQIIGSAVSEIEIDGAARLPEEKKCADFYNAGGGRNVFAITLDELDVPAIKTNPAAATDKTLYVFNVDQGPMSVGTPAAQNGQHLEGGKGDENKSLPNYYQCIIT